MKKYVFVLAFVMLLMGVLGLSFIIKILIIVGSLFVHVFTHWIIEHVKISRFRGVNELINILSANLINLIIGLICFKSGNEYVRYIALANFVICAINLIPIYPFDGRGVLDLVVDYIELEQVKLQIYKIVDRGTRAILLIIGILQLILSVNHFSVLALYMMITIFRKETMNGTNEISYNKEETCHK